MTIVLSVSSLIFSWIIAIPIGIYSATHQYSILDYIATFIALLGWLRRLLAGAGAGLACLYQARFFTTGLVSQEYVQAPWSVAKFGDLLKHLILPMVMIGLANTGGTIRTVRANLLDELNKQYVITARAKGLSEWKLLVKYPVRMAINPILSTIALSAWPHLWRVLIDIVLSCKRWDPSCCAPPWRRICTWRAASCWCSALSLSSAPCWAIRPGSGGPPHPLWEGGKMSEQTHTPATTPEVKPGPVALEDVILVDGKASDDSAFITPARGAHPLRFGRHKMAVISLVGLIIIYILAVFAEFFSPYTVDTRFEGFQQARPPSFIGSGQMADLGRIFCCHA